MTKVVEFIFILTLISAFPLILVMATTKKTALNTSLFFLGTICLCAFLPLALFFRGTEEARTKQDGQTYTIVSYMNDSGSYDFCFYKYNNVLSFEKVECFYGTAKHETVEMVTINGTILVFLEGNLRYTYGDNPFGEGWLDTIIFENHFFNLEYTEKDEEITYKLYKCNKDNTQCTQEPFYFTTPILGHGELRIPTYGEQGQFSLSIEVGDGETYSDTIYHCDFEGCTLYRAFP